jgi:hypothetical protein
VDTPFGANGVAVSGDVAYVTMGSAGLYVIDISIPYAPRMIGSLKSSEFGAYHVAVSGDYLYIASCYEGVQVMKDQCPAGP